MKFWRARKISLQFLSNHIMCPICSINKKCIARISKLRGDSNQNSYPARLNLTHLLNWRSKNLSKRENCAFRQYLVHFAPSGKQDRNATIWIFFRNKDKTLCVSQAWRNSGCIAKTLLLQGTSSTTSSSNVFIDDAIDGRSQIPFSTFKTTWFDARDVTLVKKKNPRRFFSFVFATRLFIGTLRDFKIAIWCSLDH